MCKEESGDQEMTEKQTRPGSSKSRYIVPAIVTIAVLIILGFFIPRLLPLDLFFSSSSKSGPGIKKEQLIAAEMVSFGTYEQDADKKNGPEPIEWIVLDNDGKSALLLSSRPLDALAFNSFQAEILWENSSIRAWLNDGFFNTAFTAEEKSVILLSAIDNSKAQGNPDWEKINARDTEDKVFLLSYAEARHYLENTKLMKTWPTVYANQAGAFSYPSSNQYGEGWWWLRSPGKIGGTAAVVAYEGYFSSEPVQPSKSLPNYYYHGGGSVRPAIRIDLNAL